MIQQERGKVQFRSDETGLFMSDFNRIENRTEVTGEPLNEFLHKAKAFSLRRRGTACGG